MHNRKKGKNNQMVLSNLMLRIWGIYRRIHRSKTNKNRCHGRNDKVESYSGVEGGQKTELLANLSSSQPHLPHPLLSTLLGIWVTGRDAKCRLTPKTKVTVKVAIKTEFFSVYLHACVSVGLGNELETWVRLKWLVISLGRWEPGAAWIKRLAGWLTKDISSSLSERDECGRAGESGHRAGSGDEVKRRLRVG